MSITTRKSPATEPIVEDYLDGSEDEVSIIGSESSASDDDFNFRDSEDEDDDIFEAYVDKNIFDYGFLGSADPETLYKEDEQSLDDSDELKSISGSDDEENVRYPEFNTKVDMEKRICLKVGMRFASNDIFRMALRKYSIENGGDYYYLHNDQRKVSAYCKLKCYCPMKHGRKKYVCNLNLCGFKACGRSMGSDGTFQLKTFVPNHECGWQQKNTKIYSTWLAQKYIENYRDDPDWKLTAFINSVKRDYGVEITYNHAWKSRLRAMLMTQGDARVQYAKVWDYAATLKERNPGSSTIVKVCLDSPERPIFQRLYVCIDACKQGFLMGCRPIVGLDGCHLKGAYSGQVLVAIAKDGNENIFPIAYVVVEAERKEIWGWFLDILMRDIGSSNPTFMSDRQKGLIEALHDIAPMADTRVCVRHLYNNFKSRWPGKNFKDALWAAARACTRHDFECVMDEIKKMDERAYTYLLNANPMTWSRHAFRTYTKSDMLLNNVCESFNSYILRARDKPILTMCEWIQRQLMKRFVSKREGMAKYSGVLTPKAVKRIEASKEEGLKMCRAHWGGEHKFEVDHVGKTYVVDLAEKSCGCNKWDLTGIPCPHAVCCIMMSRLKVDAFVHHYYTRENYMKTYNKMIQPMPGDHEWVKTTHLSPQPPKYVVQPGRPKKARRREQGEAMPSKQRRIRLVKSRCSQCGQEGHYKNRCSNPAKVLEPQRPQNLGGRPRNSKTVYIGSQKRKNKEKGLQPEGQTTTSSTAFPLPRAQPEISPYYDMYQTQDFMNNFIAVTQGSSTLVHEERIQITQPSPSITQNHVHYGSQVGHDSTRKQFSLLKPKRNVMTTMGQLDNVLKRLSERNATDNATI